MQDTIFALSSGALPSGVAVIRVSGTQVPEIAGAMLTHMPEARNASFQTIRSRNSEIIDEGLVLFFPGPHSFTGEDCLEFQIHGGRAVVQRLLEELGGHPNTRPAEPGEFTRRAFENGKIDLLEVEGLSDLIAAETEMQRRLAVEQANGGLSVIYKGWADRLTHARAMIEAELDFADEADVPGSVSAHVWGDISDLTSEISLHLSASRTGEIIRDGFMIAIIGPPNAGKSSLLNALARRDVAIVTDIAGTTRDIISVDMDIGGYSVRISDTAGIRDTDDQVEREGVRRATMAAREADLVLLLQDPLQSGYKVDLPDSSEFILVRTKSDLFTSADSLADAISVRTGYGIEALVEKIRRHMETRLSVNSLAIPSRIRHVKYLTETLSYLSAALQADGASLDIRAEQLRLASRSLGKITGSVDVESLLDVIFSEFCIGK